MKYLGLLCLCYLSCGTHANFFDDLKHAAQNTVNAVSNTAHQVGSAVGKVAQQVAPVAQHYGSQALSSALDVLTTDGVKTLVSAGVSAAATAAIAALGKRDIDEAVQAVSLLKQDAATLEHVLHGYSHDLQGVYDKIASLQFLEKDPKKFLADIGVMKSQYEAVLDQLVHNFEVKMAQLQAKHHKRGLVDDLTSAFHKTVDTFKQTFGGVTDNLQGSGQGLLGNLAGHLGNLGTNLQTGLTGLKQTAANLLAQGQEHLQTVVGNTVNQALQIPGAALGAAGQVVATVLHPQTSD